MKNSIAIIPCKTDSKRVRYKNLQEINGLTLLEISIKYALSSSLIEKIYVSTESQKVIDIASKYNVELIPRVKNLLGDAEVCDVYVDVIKNLIENKKINPNSYEYIVGIQPDHPDRDNSLDDLLVYAFDNKYDDLFTVSKRYVRTGSVRVIRMEHIQNGFVSRRVGCYKDDATNIHSLEDLKNAALRIKSKNK